MATKGNSFSVSLGTSVASELRQLYNAYQWKKLFLRDFLANKEEMLRHVRRLGEKRRHFLFSAFHDAQTEVFHADPEILEALDGVAKELEELPLPRQSQKRSALFRAFARMKLEGEFSDEPAASEEGAI